MNLSSVRLESKKGQILSNSNKNSPVSSTHSTFCGGIGYKLMNNKVTYRQQFTRCGKQRCRKCKEGEGHGPYWYAYWSENGRTKTKYIGVHLPPDLEPAQQDLTGEEENAAHYLLARATPTSVPRVFLLGQ